MKNSCRGWKNHPSFLSSPFAIALRKFQPDGNSTRIVLTEEKPGDDVVVTHAPYANAAAGSFICFFFFTDMWTTWLGRQGWQFWCSAFSSSSSWRRSWMVWDSSGDRTWSGNETPQVSPTSDHVLISLYSFMHHDTRNKTHQKPLSFNSKFLGLTCMSKWIVVSLLLVCDHKDWVSDRSSISCDPPFTRRVL